MVFESRIAELFQNQAARFIRGFSAEQLRLGLLTGRLELHNLSLNPEPLDSLFVESDVPLVVKAGVVTTSSAQLSLLQGELELAIDGLTIVLSPACRWLSKDEVTERRSNEIQRLEFVHTRSQSQRRTMEREMLRQMFSDYCSRLRVTVRNVHIRLEMEGEFEGCHRSQGADVALGLVLNSCEISPVKIPAAAPSKDNEVSNELLLAEAIRIKGLSLYHEMPDAARMHVSWGLYTSTLNRPMGVFDSMKQEQFVQKMRTTQEKHVAVPTGEQLMPPMSLSVGVELRSQPVRDGVQLDSCMTMDVSVRAEDPSRLAVNVHILDHIHRLMMRSMDFQFWHYLHAIRPPPVGPADRWSAVREFVAIRRRTQSNTYSLVESIQMRLHCKEYVRLYKRKSNGPLSSVAWRKTLPEITEEETSRLTDIELLYPAEKLVNFRLMAHAELKTELSINSFLTSNDESKGATGAQGGSFNDPYRRVARELTPLEQLHLHGQHGYGVNIYRGLPSPACSLKIRFDVQVPQGIFWLCSSSGSSFADQGAGAKGASSCWTAALDCAAQSVRVTLVDSIVDTSVFAMVEVPMAPAGRRPLSMLLGRTAEAFAGGSPGRARQEGSQDALCGGRGSREWFSASEFCGTVYVCCQVRTVPTSSASSPWDIYAHLSCGDVLNANVLQDKHGINMAFASERGIRRTIGETSSTKVEEKAVLRVRIPLLTAGVDGPFIDLLRWSVSIFHCPEEGLATGPEHSAIAWFARHVGTTYNIAIFRMHVRLPPVILEHTDGTIAMRLPRLDAGCLFEHGGLVDGFAVGLHNLRHFVLSLASGAGQPVGSERSGVGSGGVNRGAPTPVSVVPLEGAPPLAVVLSVWVCALAIVLDARRESRKGISSEQLAGAVRDRGLHGLLTDQLNESVASYVTLWLVIVAVIVGRRVLWDLRDSQQGTSLGEGQKRWERTRKFTEVHSLFGDVLAAVLALGLPLHSRCLQIAAWAGSLELLRPALLFNPRSPSAALPLQGLVTWAARGAFANLLTRQDEVIQWLVRMGAKIDECDRSGRTMLDWACWGGADNLVTTGLKAGLLTPAGRQAASRLPAEDNAAEDAAAAGSASPVLPALPSPLCLAVATRAPSVVAALLRASGDPHAPAHRSGGLSPLLLAVRNCEYELACQMLRDTPFVAVDAALGLAATDRRGHGGGAAMVAKSEHAEASPNLSSETRATVALIESLRRLSSALQRRHVEEAISAPFAHGAWRSHPPGPHPDDALYSSGQLPFGDIAHPVAIRLPMPLHQVSYSERPHQPPLSWLWKSEPDVWGPATLFIECCLRRGFNPDAQVASRALPALPTDVRRLVMQLLQNSGPVDTPPIEEPPTLLRTSAVTSTWLGGVFGNELEGNGRQVKVPPILSNGCYVPDSGQSDREIRPGASFVAQKASAYLDQGLWSSEKLHAAMARLHKSHDTTQASSSGNSGTPHTSCSLPAIRVVVLGPPQVGKSEVARCLIDELGGTDEPSYLGETDTAWLKVTHGAWPRDGAARAEVDVWDSPSAPLPGLFARAIGDSWAPLLVVLVRDAALVGTGAPADVLVADCLHGVAPLPPRSRVLVVDNEFRDEQPPSATTSQSFAEVWCSFRIPEGTVSLRKTFGALLTEVVKELETRVASGTVPRHLPSMPFRSHQVGSTEVAVCSSMPPLGICLDPGGDRALATKLRGDSLLVDPSIVTWVWAMLCAAQGSLGALVPWDRLERVLSTTSAVLGTEDGTAAAATMLRVLADLGLVCPIPSLNAEGHEQRLDCEHVLVPDFARRVRLTSSAAERLADSKSGLGGSGPGPPVSGGWVTSQPMGDNAAPMAVSARLIWDSADSQPPSLRTVIRDFLARGALRNRASSGGPCFLLQVHRFVLLESGPGGSAGWVSADDLGPGFLLVFDLVSATSISDYGEQQDSGGATAAKLPGSRVSARQADAAGNGVQEDDLGTLGPASHRLTAMIVGSSYNDDNIGAPFWDVHCSGPHAQWAWRALLGSGASVPGFAAFHCSNGTYRSAAQHDPSNKAWPLPVPSCILSTSASAAKGCPGRPTGRELFGLAWLLHGPSAVSARSALLPAAEGDGTLAGCCAALCGRKRHHMLSIGFDDDCLVDGLTSCADFEASLIARSWHTAPQYLDQALAAGVEAWALCAAVLARIAHDFAADAAGSFGRALPLLQDLVQSGADKAGSGSKKAVALVIEGPQPLTVGLAARPTCAPLGSIRGSAAVKAWLSLCKPAAVWNIAGGSRGFTDDPPAPQQFGGGSHNEQLPQFGAQVVEALQAALAVQLTEQMVSEVWDALSELELAQTLTRRACGTWTQVAGSECESFVL